MSATAMAPRGAVQMQSPQEWVDAFAEGWRDAAPAGADAFVGFFKPFMHPEVRLAQPMLPDVHGPEGFEHGFARPTFALFDSLRGEVLHAGIGDQTAHIELRLDGVYGGRPVSWVSHDRCVLRDGLLGERVAFFDPAPLVVATLTRPRAWPRFARSRLATKRGGRR